MASSLVRLLTNRWRPTITLNQLFEFGLSDNEPVAFTSLLRVEYDFNRKLFLFPKKREFSDLIFFFISRETGFLKKKMMLFSAAVNARML